MHLDTLDLQDHDTPSASDHGRNPHPAPLGAGPAAPHQQQTLRNLDQGRSAEQDQLADSWGSRGSSGRSSHEGSELLDQDTRISSDDTRIDDGALEQNNDDASEVEDGDDIPESDRSSSPSIDDNGKYLPCLLRADSSPSIAKSPAPFVPEEVKGSARSTTIEIIECVPHPVLRHKARSIQARQFPMVEPLHPWDLFEPESDKPTSLLPNDGSSAFRQINAGEARPLQSIDSLEEEGLAEELYPSHLVASSTQESDWEDIIDDSSDSNGDRSTAAQPLFLPSQTLLSISC